MAESDESPTGRESLGAELRKQREIREISLKEIADATKISKRYLEALESDQHGVLPASVFTRGFVREFARYIGLDAEEMADRYNAQFTEANGEASGGGGQTDSQPLPLIRVDRNIVVFGILLVAFSIVVWWVWGHLGNPVNEPSPTIVTETVEPAIAPPVSEPVPVPPPTVEAEPSRLEMRISVLDDTWVILHVDGELATNEVLRAGDVRNYSANNEFRFEVVGNAGGLDLSLNGTPIPALGVRGRVVRDRVFGWDNLKELQEASTRDDT